MDENVSELQRVKKVVKWLIFKGYADNETDLAKLLGYTKSSFSQIINGKVNLSEKFIDKLISLDSNINKVWISTGQGEMFNNETIVQEPPDKSYTIAEKEKIIEWLNRELEDKRGMIRHLIDESNQKNNEINRLKSELDMLKEELKKKEPSLKK